MTALERLGGVARATDIVRLSSRKRLRTAVATGRMIRLHRGRFALADAATAAKDAAAVSGVVSHLSAALHWGWAVTWVPERVWVTVPRKRHPRNFRDGRVRLVLSDLGPDDLVDGATSPLRTVLDCARRLPFDEALAVADSALRSRLVTLEELRLAAIVLEFPALHVEPQGAITTRHRVYHPDLVERGRRLALEADSWEFHGGKDAHATDCVRYTELTLAGWRVIRFTWEQVMHYPAYVRDVLTTLACEHPAGPPWS